MHPGMRYLDRIAATTQLGIWTRTPRPKCPKRAATYVRYICLRAARCRASTSKLASSPCSTSLSCSRRSSGGRLRWQWLAQPLRSPRPQVELRPRSAVVAIAEYFAPRSTVAAERATEKAMATEAPVAGEAWMGEAPVVGEAMVMLAGRRIARAA